MRTYVAVTGTLFALITVAHIARIFLEHEHLATDPAYWALTLLAAGLSVWAFRLWRGPRP
ncbi:MAG: hypothetical protein R2729_17350 [Bryobacteraceae bacterium]